MKPAPFAYEAPRSLDEAVALLVEHGDDAAVIAGGQSLVPLLNMRLARPDVVVDLRLVPGLRHVQVTSETVRVGAMVTAVQFAGDADAMVAIPGLAAALGDIGHPQIRNRTTVGGSIAHADPAGELPTVLTATGGEVVLQGPGGVRTVGPAEFFEGAYVTARRSDEVVAEVRFRRPSGPSVWIEVARRPSDFALVGVFASVTVGGDGVVTGANIGICGTGSRPERPAAVEAALIGRPLDDAAVGAASAVVVDVLEADDDVHASGDYRLALASVLTRRALEELMP